MKYNCRECKHECDTVMSYLRCPNCKASLEESIRIADKQWLEEQQDLAADQARRGLVWNDKRASRA